VTTHGEDSYALYQQLLDGVESDEAMDRFGVPPIAREQARMVLGVNIYTQCVWKCDLKNTLHYLKLRTDPHAQYEIRVFADAIARVVEALFPAAWGSFKDNFIDGVNVSESELGILRSILVSDDSFARMEADRENVLLALKGKGWTARRYDEFAAKIKKMRIFGEEKIRLMTDVGELLKHK
jgi:thymidylate synthase ThyX